MHVSVPGNQIPPAVQSKRVCGDFALCDLVKANHLRSRHPCKSAWPKNHITGVRPSAPPLNPIHQFKLKENRSEPTPRAGTMWRFASEGTAADTVAAATTTGHVAASSEPIGSEPKVSAGQLHQVWGRP